MAANPQPPAPETPDKQKQVGRIAIVWFLLPLIALILIEYFRTHAHG
jgi:hypothetical protein